MSSKVAESGGSTGNGNGVIVYLDWLPHHDCPYTTRVVNVPHRLAYAQLDFLQGSAQPVDRSLHVFTILKSHCKVLFFSMRMNVGNVGPGRCTPIQFLD